MLKLCCYIFVLSLPLGFISFVAIPAVSDRIDQVADQSQSKCSKRGLPDDPLRLARPAHAGEVLTIRLTNAGELVDRCELTDILYELNWDYERCSTEFRPRRSQTAVSRPKLVVMYVHGWKHNADKDDQDVERFNEFIDDLSNANKDEKQVLGVYVGWNAKPRVFPLTLPYIENLSFWSKKKAADRIAQSTILTKIVSSIGAVLDQAAHDGDQFITIGHSFGARILFSATGQTLIYQTEHSHPGYPGGQYKAVRGPADAIILLNPAFEASLFTALNDASRQEETFGSQLPVLLSISSVGDDATKRAFPIAQWLEFSRSPREMTTIGNYTNYQTHTLFPSNEDSCISSLDDTLSEIFFASGLCMSRLSSSRSIGISGYHPHNPFLVARTSKDVINDHNDIWGNTFSKWLLQYIDRLQRAKSAQTDVALVSRLRYATAKRCGS